MNNLELIEAVKLGDLPRVEELIKTGADINQQDDQGWTPLNWAAGKGDASLVRSLLDANADLFLVGRDQRTSYVIALAAGHAEVAKLLRSAEDMARPERTRETRCYCKAYPLGKFRQFAGFEHELRSKELVTVDEKEGQVFSDEKIVFLHQDFTVTRSMWPNEDVVFDQVTPEWQEFCSTTLRFKVPDDLDLIATVTRPDDADDAIRGNHQGSDQK
jgi:uncharacterized protein